MPQPRAQNSPLLAQLLWAQRLPQRQMHPSENPEGTLWEGGGGSSVKDESREGSGPMGEGGIPPGSVICRVSIEGQREALDHLSGVGAGI